MANTTEQKSVPTAPIKSGIIAVKSTPYAWAGTMESSTTPFLESVTLPPETKFKSYTLLPLTARLGLPLIFLPKELECFPNMTDIPEVDTKHLETLGLFATPCNVVLRHFSSRLMPETTKIGFSEVEGVPRPEILLARADREDLLVEHVQVLWHFIDGEMKRSMEGPADDAPASFYAELTREKFVKFWEVSELARKIHLGMECPVKMGCKACGKEDEKLMRCGKCTIVKYCGSECQMADWAKHRKVCFKA